MTTTRNPGTAPVFRAFRELSGLPPDERREALMVRLEHIWDEAQGRSYVNKHDVEVANPDGTLQLKVIQAVAVLQGMTGPAAEAEGAKLAALTDAELVREATKRLPPHEINALADALIAMREQQTEKQAILTTGETANEPRKAKRKKDPKGAVDRAAESGPQWPEPGD